MTKIAAALLALFALSTAATAQVPRAPAPAAAPWCDTALGYAEGDLGGALRLLHARSAQLANDNEKLRAQIADLQRQLADLKPASPAPAPGKSN